MEHIKNRRKIILEDGTVYHGEGFGSLSSKKAEIVFNTSMVGYQEIISDPSYTYQMVVMTYPLIGNYGICEDDYETEIPTVSGLIVHEYCDAPSNFRCGKTLSEVMKEYDIVGISGIDTRMLGRHIRDFGSCKACIVDEEYDEEIAVRELHEWVPKTDAVSVVSTGKIYDFTEKVKTLPGKSYREAGTPAREAGTPAEIQHNYKIVAIDCGIKKNILREMVRKGLSVTVVPWNTSAETIMSYNPDGVFISNGPGDPTDVGPTIDTIKKLKGKLPIFGICLGHQIISLAYGAQTYKLKFGHRGGNHPVKDIATGRIEITSQNHSYAVIDESLEGTGLVKTHINILDNTIEGVECKKDRVFSVQYHPESAPGPQDSSYLFDRFISLIDESHGLTAENLEKEGKEHA